MPKYPLKISEKGRPLSCADHDANIDALLDRQNHTGTQLSNTISDLPDFIESLPLILSLENSVSILDTRVSDLQEDLLGGGFLSETLNSLEEAYKAADRQLDSKIQNLNSLISDLQTSDSNFQGLIDNLTGRVTGNDEDIDQIRGLLDDYNQTIQDNKTKIEGLDLRLDTVEDLLGDNNIGELLDDFESVNDLLQPLRDGGYFLVPPAPHDATGMILGWSEANNEPEWRLPDFISGGNLIDDPNELRLTVNLNP